jgi:hypothetical protein
MPMPGIFSKIASLCDSFGHQKRCEEIHPAMPPGLIKFGEEWIQSEVIRTGDGPGIFVKGRFDILAALDDGTFGVFDFKTGAPNEDKVEIYTNQLRAYAYALEHAAPGELAHRPISKLGLVFFTPEDITSRAAAKVALETSITWLPIEPNESAFIAYITEVERLLVREAPKPQLCESCAHCAGGKRCAAPGYSSDSLCNCCQWCIYKYATDVATVLQAAQVECPKCGAPMRKQSGKFGNFLSCSKYPECKGTRNL